MRDQDLARREEVAESPTMRELVMVLFRQRKLFVGVAGLIFVLAVVYAFTGANYRAHLRVLVRRGRADPPVAAQENAPPDFSRVEVTEEELNSEVELLKDDDVLRRVAEANDLAAHDWLRWLRPHETQAARVERAAKRLAGKLEVEPIKKTNLIAVSYGASDPQLAARVLRSLASVYLEKHMEVHRPRGQLQFFDQQTAESRRQLEEARGKVGGLREEPRRGDGRTATRSDACNESTTWTRATSKLRRKCLTQNIVFANSIRSWRICRHGTLPRFGRRIIPSCCGR